MPYGTSNHRTVGKTQVPIPVQSADWGWDKIIVSKRRPRPYKSVAPNHAHLQTGILSDHAVFHHSSHKQGRAEGKKRPIAHNRQHQLDILRDIYIISNNTVLDHCASVNGYIVPNRGRTMNNCMRVNHTVFANLHEFRALQHLASFINCLAQDS